MRCSRWLNCTVMFLAGAGWVAQARAQRAYWTNLNAEGDGVVSSARLDGTDLVEPANTRGVFPGGIALDLSAGKMYWTDSFTLVGGDGVIHRANLDGSSPEMVVESGFSNGVAIDHDGGKVYWTRPDGVYRANAEDGADIEPLIPVSGAAFSAVGIAIDPVNDHVYWTEGSAGAGRIFRANLDGGDVTPLYAVNNTNPAAIAIDAAGGKIYWVDSVLRNLQRANLDGTSVQQLAGPTGGEFPTGVALDLINGKVYWTLADLIDSIGRIRRANLNGTSAENYQSSVIDPKGIAIQSGPEIVASLPPRCAIDAREPHLISDPSVRFGWNSIDLTFASAVAGLAPSDFAMEEIGGDGLPPVVALVIPLGAVEVRVSFDQTIEPGAWTCVRHVGSGSQACLGYLPSDVNADRTSGPIDVLRLIDHLNGVENYEGWQVDLNRSALAEPQDVLRAVDLLNGADQFIPWLGATLPECPSR